MSTADRSEVFLFKDFGLERNGRELVRFDKAREPVPVPIGWRAIEVLSVLIEQRGATVSRKQILDAVWPGAVVEESNLTVQIAALRRVLDEGDTQESCIQTVPRRGYRFVWPVTRMSDAPYNAPAPTTELPASGIAVVPRLSFVVLPFTSLGDSADELHLADAITKDLTTDLARLPGAVARHSAATCEDRSIDIRRLGEALGVRYAIEGNVRKLGDTLRVNVQLISTETNSHIWAGRFDQVAEDGALGQDAIVGRLRGTLALQMLSAESARGVRDRADQQDAFDLLLRAWPTWGNTSSPESLAEAASLFEQSLRLDASLVPAMCGLAYNLIDQYKVPGSIAWADESLLERAATLIAKAASIEPGNERVLFSQGFLLLGQARFAEACAVLQRVAELFPSEYPAYRALGLSMIANGQPDLALPALERAIRLDPLSPTNRFMFLWAGYALLLLQRDEAALPWFQKALAGGATASPAWLHRCYLYMASAHALLGNAQQARWALGEANRLWPFATIRGLPPTVCGPRGLPHPVLRTQVLHILEGLRRAGLRDHAEEDADWGVAPGSELHDELFGHTPITVPGAATISTLGLKEILISAQPVLIDVALESWGWSLPGAIGLQGTGHGSALPDAWQRRFQAKMHALTDGDLSAPIVAFCTNSERFTGYNLACRLVPLGYRNVFWYRGGREAWSVAGLPEAELSVHEW